MDAASSRRPSAKRARRAGKATSDVGNTSEHDRGVSGGRPTAVELQEALGVIRQMKEAVPPILSRRGQPPKPNVVACAIAMRRGEKFESDSEAQRLFGVPTTTMVRRD